MRKGKMFLSVLVAIAMIITTLSVIPFAAGKSENPTFPDMPNDWSTAALENAVANGLLQGADGKILPNDNLTRAQMATVITRAFGATVKGDLKGFSDVKTDDWFADYMAKAYKMGVIQGSDGKLNPNDSITRQEVFAIIARALKLEPAVRINKSFTDINEISDWAKGEVYGLINAGYIQGSDGKLNPKGKITRAEFAQVFDNILKQYIQMEGTVSVTKKGNIMINKAGVTLTNSTIDGDLIIGDGVGDGEVTLDNVKIIGRLVIRGGNPIIKGNEFRAAWVSTVYNLDWPSKKGLSQAKQKQEFIFLLDELKKAGLNAVIVQIKPSADSFYPSEYAPWSEYLTGVQGQNPGYNPLSFMIEEAHKRDMEFHAWFNPYRVSVKGDIEELSKDHPARKNPDWVVSYGGKLYYNPGIPEVRQFVIDSILEVVRDYNIDGVHLDDYFYPYPEKGVDFPDDELYKANKRFDKETKDQWRRNNINDFIENLYQSIKREKTNVKFGVSPFGIWRNKVDDPKGSDTRGGITSYDSLYADTKYWVENGWLDYIAPQIYWHFGYDRADYSKVADWWVNTTKGYKVNLYIGHAAYKIEAGDTPWGNPLEIINQIQYNRKIPQIKGSIFFRAKSIIDNPLGLMDKLKNDIYKEEAKTP